MLKHKLMRKEVQTLDELMELTNAFSISDFVMRLIHLSASGLIQEQPAGQQSAQAGGSGPNRHERCEQNRNNNNNYNNNNKRKDSQPDAQYGNRQVVAVQGQEAPGASRGSRRQKPGERL